MDLEFFYLSVQRKKSLQSICKELKEFQYVQALVPMSLCEQSSWSTVCTFWMQRAENALHPNTFILLGDMMKMLYMSMHIFVYSFQELYIFARFLACFLVYQQQRRRGLKKHKMKWAMLICGSDGFAWYMCI